MLDSSKLAKSFKEALDETLPVAIKQGYLSTLDRKSEVGDNNAEKFAQTITDLCSDALSRRFAAAIDTYIKNANVCGSIMQPFVSAGSPTFHTGVFTCAIQTAPVGKGGGITPNVFTIQ